jgi:hypothetical protein
MPRTDPEANPLPAQASNHGPAGEGHVGSAEAVREELIFHEAIFKSIGSLYLSAGFLCVVALFTLLISESVGLPVKSIKMSTVESIVALSAFAAFGIFIGMFLRRLHPAIRVAWIASSAAGMLHFPLGTLINGYFLYVLFSDKGRRVFAPEYQEIIKQTPHVKYHPSIIVTIVFGLMFITLLLLFFRVLLTAIF